MRNKQTHNLYHLIQIMLEINIKWPKKNLVKLNKKEESCKSKCKMMKGTQVIVAVVHLQHKLIKIF